MDNSIPVLHKIDTNKFTPPAESDKTTAFQKGVIFSLLSIDKRLLKISNSLDSYFNSKKLSDKNIVVPRKETRALSIAQREIPTLKDNALNKSVNINSNEVVSSFQKGVILSLVSIDKRLLVISNYLNNFFNLKKLSNNKNIDSKNIISLPDPSLKENINFSNVFQKGVIFSLLSIDKRLLKIDTNLSSCCTGVGSTLLKNSNLLSYNGNSTVALPSQPQLALPSPNAKAPVVKPKNNNLLDKFLVKLSDLKDSFLKSLNKEIKDFKENSLQGIRDLRNYFVQGFLGPLNLIIQPLSDLFGKDLTDKIGSIFSKIIKSPISLLKLINKGVTTRMQKMGLSFLDKGKIVKPKRNSVLKSNPEIVWLADELDSKNKKKNSNNGIFNIPNLKAITGLIPGMLLKAGVLGALTAGLVWSFVEGIKGIKFSKKWGVSKVSGFIGGFLGGTSSGFKNAFSGMGRWALLGSSTGFLVAGPVGALAGGLIGAALGGILGYIGGANIAKGFDSLGKKIKDEIFSKENIVAKIAGVGSSMLDGLFNAIESIGSVIPEMIVKLVTKDSKKAQKAGIVAKGINYTLLKISPLGLLQDSFNIIKNVSKVIMGKGTAKEKIQSILSDIIIEPYKSLMNNPIFSRMNILDSSVQKKIKDAVVDSLGTIKTTSIDVASSLKKFVSNIFADIGDGVEDFFKTNPLVNAIKNNVVKPIETFFTSIGDFFEFLTTMNPIKLAKTVLSGSFDKNLEDYKASKDVDRTLASDDYKSYASKQGKSFNKLSDEDKVNTYKKSTTKVNDAIISPNGRIVRPSKDDTIIATKSPVKNIKKSNDGDIQVLLAQINKKLDSKFDASEILSKLDKLISTIENKPFNNIAFATNNNNIDFDKLRMKQ